MTQIIGAKLSIVLIGTIVLSGATEYPQAAISNGEIKATLNLPDPKRGYYRGTRFDWSGVIASLEYKGHTFFAPFYEKFDPAVRDVESARPARTSIPLGSGAQRSFTFTPMSL